VGKNGTYPLPMGLGKRADKAPASSNQVGTVSLDTAQLAMVDAMYLLGDEDHDAGRTAAEVVPRYDGALADVGSDGVFPVFVDYDGEGRPLRVRVELA
jgi:hypothetical protein